MIPNIWGIYIPCEGNPVVKNLDMGILIELGNNKKGIAFDCLAHALYLLYDSTAEEKGLPSKLGLNDIQIHGPAFICGRKENGNLSNLSPSFVDLFSKLHDMEVDFQ